MPEPGHIYAKALFEAADEAGRLKPVADDLHDIGTALGESRQLVGALFNPAFPEEGKKTVLAKLSSSADPLVQNSLLVLLDHGRLDALPEFLEAFDELYNASGRQLEVELTTAIPIDDAQADGLRATLAANTGQSVTLVRKVDPSILGGVVLRVRDLLIDASVRGRLDALRLNLRKARLAAPSQGDAA